MEKYYVSDGAGGKEIPIIKKEDPYKAILAKADAPRTEEKVRDEIVAGDDTVDQSQATFAGLEEAVIEPPKEIIYGHCNNCRLELTEERVTKTPIDWLRNEDGTLSKAATRFSIFCKNCMKFITIIDKDAQAMLNNMIRKGIKN